MEREPEMVNRALVRQQWKTEDWEEVVRAQKRRVRAEEEYLDALETFLGNGGTYSDLGRLLGVSRQAVRQYVERGRKS
jgi:hypothetical protein